MGEKERRLLPHLGDQTVQVVRGRRAADRRQPLGVLGAGQQPVLRAVDQFALLVLLDGLNGQPELLGDLVVRAGIEVRDPGVDIENGLDRSEAVLAGIRLVVDEGVRERGLVVIVTLDVHGLGVDDLVHPVDTGLDRHPGQQMHQPARRDGRHLRDGLGGVRQGPGGGIPQGDRLWRRFRRFRHTSPLRQWSAACRSDRLTRRGLERFVRLTIGRLLATAV